MIATWPTDLPRPERSTWSAQLQDGRRKKQGDTGPAGFGGRFSSVAEKVSLSLLLTRDQKAVFDNFYRVDCAAVPHARPDDRRLGVVVL
jgi:hypothetical protein